MSLVKTEIYKCKYIHITLQNVLSTDKKYWMNKALKLRSNIQAVFLGVESNLEKGYHVHIVTQFSTEPQLSRKQFVENFETNSVCLKKLVGKDNLLRVLGYVAKFGNNDQYGDFTFRNAKITCDPEVYRFNYMVKSPSDADNYFRKVVHESLDRPGIIELLSMASNDIGHYLRIRPAFRREMMKYEAYHKSRYRDTLCRGLSFSDISSSHPKMRKAYASYLRKFPKLFAAQKTIEDEESELEADFKDYVDHDLKNLSTVINVLKFAVEHGYNRPLKSLNLWIWSSLPGFGKTRLLNSIKERMITYRLPDDEFYTEYENHRFQVIVSDEAEGFIKSKGYGHLKQLLEGIPVEFNRKHKDKIIKSDNPLIILADNKSCEYLMSKRFESSYNKKVMDARILDLEFKSRASLHFLVDKIFN